MKHQTQPTQPVPKKASIYLIDDHPLLVRGVSQLINSQPDMAAIGSSADWTVALKEIGDLQPDVVLLDVTLANINGVEVLKNLRIHYPALKVLMLSMHDESMYALRCLKAGASGYIMKATATEEAVVAIRQVMNGEIYLSNRMSKQTMAQLVGRKLQPGASPLSILSDRELEVFHMVGDGLTTRNIAEKLHLSVKTIETHKMHIKEKLNFTSSAQMTQQAIQWNT
jgi:DNA-binding NarL/FixJ family response regulator